MMLDGEYRTAFIADEHPELNYGTAPFPVADGQEDRYGAGYVTGSIIGIPRDSENQAAAWELVKYLTTDTDALVTLANQLANVPTTPAAAKSPKLDLGPQFDPFIHDLQEPGHTDDPDHRLGQPPTRSCSSRSSPSTRPARSTTCRPGSRTPTRRSTPRRRTPRAAARAGCRDRQPPRMSATVAAGGARPRPVPEPGSPAGAAEGDLAPPATRAAADEPVAPRR